MSKFAKIFESKKYGQLCVLAASENDQSNPEVRIFFEPPNLGVCSLAMIFSDTDDGWDNRTTFFKELNLEKVEEMVKGPIDKAAVFGG